MERLRQRDLRALLDFLGEAYAITDLDVFIRHITHALPTLVDCDILAYNEMNPRARRAEWVIEPAVERLPDEKRIFAEHMGHHPFLVNRDVLRRSAIKISDFLSSRQWQRLPIYNEFYRGVGMEHLIGFEIPPPPPLIIGIGPLRERRDFGERDRLLVNLLCPHLSRAYQNAEAATLMLRALESLRQGEGRHGVLILTRDGHIRQATAHARHLLADYFGRPRRENDLPEQLHRWVAHHERTGARGGEVPPLREPFVAERESRRLVVRLISERTQRLLLLGEQVTSVSPAALERLGLSQREAEVLGWVAAGKTNPEIATILGRSPRTVQHHLEHILRKLGVETRTAAAARAFEALRGPAPEG